MLLMLNLAFIALKKYKHLIYFIFIKSLDPCLLKIVLIVLHAEKQFPKFVTHKFFNKPAF